MPKIVFDKEVITDKSALNTAGLFNDGNNYYAGKFIECAGYIKFGAGCNGGQVVLETAPDSTYSGTWAILSTTDFSAENKVHHVAVTGCFKAVRFRISQAITGGTVTVEALGIAN